MITKVNLSNVKQCDQVWDLMSPCEKGRLCAKCDNVIHDFRGKTDMEIALIHSRSKKKVCGIYDEKTVNPINNPDNEPSSNKKYLLAGALSILIPTSSSYAGSQHLPKTQIELSPRTQSTQVIKPTEDKNSSFQQTDTARTIKGYVFDPSDEPLAGANVIINNTSTGTATSIDGSFSLSFLLTDLADLMGNNKSMFLTVSYIGYGRKEIEISKNDIVDNQEINLDIFLEEDLEMISFYVQRQPFHKRAWNSIKNVFRKKN